MKCSKHHLIMKQNDNEWGLLHEIKTSLCFIKKHIFINEMLVISEKLKEVWPG